jgi:hypothetical protein
MIGTAALVDAANVVVNRIVVETEKSADYVPAEGLTLVIETLRTGGAAIGGSWDGTVFSPPPEPALPAQPKGREVIQIGEL